MKLLRHLQDTKQELYKVTWPTKNKVLSLVIIVFIIMFLVLAYVFLVDTLIAFVFRLLGRLI
jgi:preprotein translocase subunit SecE